MANSIIKPKATITTNTLTGPDLNEIKTNFMGYVAQSTNNPPQVTTNNGNLIANFAQNGSRGYQIFRPYNSMRLFVRAYNLNSDTNWRAWEEVYTTNSTNPIDDLDLNAVDYAMPFTYVLNITNGPSGASKYGFLLSLVRTTYRKQFYTSYNTDAIYTRTYVNNAWSTWKSIQLS